MKAKGLVDALAKQNRSSRAEAQDQVDELVRYIVKSLRQGKPVVLPGVGKLETKATDPARRSEVKR
jgi:nucleoid DNA-binding protein